MALEAHLGLPLEWEAGGIDDGGADAVEGLSGTGGVGVVASGPVAALTVDAFDEAAGEPRAAVPSIGSGFDLGVPGVAEQAAVIHLAGEAGVVGAVVAGTHGPSACGVEGKGKLDEAAVGGAVEVRARVVAGAEPIMGFAFEGK
jgi:hypothetical protein